jgi:hypothetical protein
MFLCSPPTPVTLIKRYLPFLMFSTIRRFKRLKGRDSTRRREDRVRLGGIRKRSCREICQPRQLTVVVQRQPSSSRLAALPRGGPTVLCLASLTREFLLKERSAIVRADDAVDPATDNGSRRRNGGQPFRQLPPMIWSTSLLFVGSRDSADATLLRSQRPGLGPGELTSTETPPPQPSPKMGGLWCWVDATV